VKLTGTNNSIDLIVLITYIHQYLAHAPKELRGRAAKAATAGRPCGRKPGKPIAKVLLTIKNQLL
jgi:hypothetical protein